ncbi:DUF6463 family protein [Nocardia sp. NPDC056952]|uniref:DUF6463 family protein n=1 Tax=Nocardia sp. NPDC056952 TaxID=3345979 RepID=UPI0036311F48
MDSRTRFPLAGTLLTFIGTVHTALGVAVFAAGDQDVELTFWFTEFGVVSVGFGLAMIALERALGYVPGTVLLVLGVATVFGLAFMPLSGFITVLLPLGVGVFGWWRARNARATA